MAVHNNFTLRFTGRAKSLTTPISVGKTPTDPEEYEKQPMYHEVSGLWDTGATNSCITADVAAAIGAIPTGKTMVHGAHGAQLTNTYLVDFVLPNKVRIRNVKVTEVVSTVGGFGVIVGMDIISAGDFCITNLNGKTVFSFRIPSMKEIDFTAVGAPENTIETKVPRGGPAYTPPKKKRKK